MMAHVILFFGYPYISRTKGGPCGRLLHLPNFFGLDWGKSYAYRYIQIVDIVSVDAI
jgi:hypothetical protein